MPNHTSTTAIRCGAFMEDLLKQLEAFLRERYEAQYRYIEQGDIDMRRCYVYAGNEIGVIQEFLERLKEQHCITKKRT